MKNTGILLGGSDGRVSAFGCNARHVHARKYKKGEEKKTAAVTYGVIAGAAFSYLIVEALLIIWFAEGISHM